MPINEIKQVMINGRLIGIAGVDAAIKEVAKLQKDLSDEEIAARLFEIISLNNYIPAKMREDYKKALLREFKIDRGLPTAAENIPGLRIGVLGMGCARCTQLESDVRDVLSEMAIAADLYNITDLQEISRYRLMGEPALVINGKVVSVGEVPAKSQIRQWIIESDKPAGKV
ncbi:MAG: thioredoxin family protein [Smithellaceae bacterium]|jgi:hypothetical protein